VTASSRGTRRWKARECQSSDKCGNFPHNHVQKVKYTAVYYDKNCNVWEDVSREMFNCQMVWMNVSVSCHGQYTLNTKVTSKHICVLLCKLLRISVNLLPNHILYPMKRVGHIKRSRFLGGGLKYLNEEDKSISFFL
jgi:hypothetical protein